MKTAFLILLLCATTACSSNPSGSSAAGNKVAQTNEPSDGVICTYERSTDSFLRERRCTTPEQREAERLQRETQMDVRNERDSGL